MKVGIGTWTYPWAVGVPGHPPTSPMTALDLLDRALELGVAVVQIADNMPLDAFGEEELEELSIRASEVGVAVEVGTCGFGEDHLRRYLDIAVIMSSPLLRVVIDSPASEPTPEEIHAILQKTLPAFEEAGVDLLIENHDRFTAYDLKQILTRAASDRLGVVFDTVNSLGCVEDAERVLTVLGPWVRNVHIKDVVVSRAENRMGFHVTGAPAGQGGLRLSSLIEDISRLPANPTLLIEQWPVFEDDLDTTIRTEAQWARQSVEHVRSLIAATVQVTVQ